MTTDLLMEAGGWKEMKEARRIHRSGSVHGAFYRDGILEGMVRDRGAAVRARLRIESRTDMENLCTCPKARRDGIICAHVLAVGLDVIEPHDVEGAKGAAVVPAPAAANPEQIASAAASAAPAKPVPGGWPNLTDTATESAVAATCHVILAPKFISAWEKGQIMIGVEVETNGERRLLSTVAKEATLFLDAHDAPLLGALKALTPAEVPGMMTVGRETFLQLLDILAGHPRVTFGKDAAARIDIAPCRPLLELREALRLRVCWDEGDGTPLIGASGTWVLCAGVFRPVAPGLPAEMGALFSVSGLRLDPARARETIHALGEAFEITPGIASQLPEPAAPLVALNLEGSLNHLEAVLSFRYCGESFLAGASSSGVAHLVTDPASGSQVVTTPALEESAADALTRWGFQGPDRNGKFVLKDRQAILRFHAHGISRLDRAWEVSTGERFEHAARQVIPVNATFEFQGGGDSWFDVSLEFETASGGSVSRQEIQRLLQTGQNHKKLSDGLIAVIDADLAAELQATISDCDPAQARPGTFRIDRRLGSFLGHTARENAVPCRGAAPWNTSPKANRDALGDLATVLRPYQCDGVAWMCALSEKEMGGILADDMGLGKTLQALAFLKIIGGRALVVCPSSLVFNWIDEVRKFLPETKVVAIDGPDRWEKRVDEGKDAELWVTSYALLRRDDDTWRQLSFDAVILDEAQQIKNPDSQVAKAACALHARHRFALTGTPIENSVRDIWSVMNFVMPGYLGGRRAFTERFEKPISLGKGNAPELGRRLRRRLMPVVMRRLKSEVAGDLPEKIEQTIYCELNARQKDVYGSILRESRNAILDAEGGRKRMLALTALLRLRQACCDLRLLGLAEVDPGDASVKVDTLRELLAEAIEGEHRVLVFSQFVEMLRVLVPLLHEQGHAYCYLDGQTKNRGEVVAKFQNDPDIPVFLISLKAGGVGLNLTAADTVIHVDPWWNPAVEAQATDRAHRIGQHRVVTSYKLIARDTVEEKILALQERKRKTISAVMDSDTGALIPGLSEAEMFELIQ